jgi:hypothetical protein
MRGEAEPNSVQAIIKRADAMRSRASVEWNVLAWQNDDVVTFADE